MAPRHKPRKITSKPIVSSAAKQESDSNTMINQKFKELQLDQGKMLGKNRGSSKKLRLGSGNKGISRNGSLTQRSPAEQV